MRSPGAFVIAVSVPVERAVGVRNVAATFAVIGNFESHNAFSACRAMILDRLQSHSVCEGAQTFPYLRWGALRLGRVIDRHIRAATPRQNARAFVLAGCAEIRNFDEQIRARARMVSEFLLSPAQIVRVLLWVERTAENTRSTGPGRRRIGIASCLSMSVEHVSSTFAALEAEGYLQTCAKLPIMRPNAS